MFWCPKRLLDTRYTLSPAFNYVNKMGWVAGVSTTFRASWYHAHGCPLASVKAESAPASGSSHARKLSVPGAKASAWTSASVTIDAEIESHFGDPDHQTLFDPLFCALNLQNLMECYELLCIRAPQNT